jgi:hypothetical protein
MGLGGGGGRGQVVSAPIRPGTTDNHERLEPSTASVLYSTTLSNGVLLPGRKIDERSDFVVA